MDFDDLLAQSVRLFSEFPEVREKWQRKTRGTCWSTNSRIPIACNSNSSPIWLPASRRTSASWAMTIKAFMDGGAEVSNILEFENYFPNPRIIRLEQNYSQHELDSERGQPAHLAQSPSAPKRLWSPGHDGESVRVIAVPDDRTEAEFVTQEVAALCADGNVSQQRVAVIYRMNAQSRLLEENFRRLRNSLYRLVGGESLFRQAARSKTLPPIWRCS